MRYSWKDRFVPLAALLGFAVLGFAVFGTAAPAATALAGNWKVTVVSEGKQFVLVIIKIADRDGKPTGRIVGPAERKDIPVEDVAVEAGVLRFTLRMGGAPFRFCGYAAKDETKPKKLVGSVQPPGNAEPLILERTEAANIAAKDAEKDSPGFAELERALGEKDAAKREAALKALAVKHAGEPVALAATETLAKNAVASGESAENVAALAELYFKAAAVYGREMQQHAALQLVRGLLSTDKNAGLALEYARKVEKQLAASDPLTQQAVVLKVLSQALSKSGKAEQAKTLDERLVKLEKRLDDEFEKRAIPFVLEAPPRRQGNSERVVLLELFTGAQCPPCVAADIAFDAVLKTRKSSDVALLQYHLHIPGPDALTNADSEKRKDYYHLEGTPTVFVDGKETDPLGGPRSLGKESYATLRKRLDAALVKNAAASLKLVVRRDGDKLDLAADVADLAKTGDRVRLRFALVEEMVRYPARNGQRLHHHVVRSFPGGVDGFALSNASFKKKVSVNLAEVKKTLASYLDAAAKEQGFPDANRPLDMKRLKVVAFVQDDTSKEVLQAAQANVPEAK